MSVKISIGLINGQLIHIADAKRGLDCDCTCLECGRKLSARKAGVKAHHFAHYKKSDGLGCSGGVETALHKYAKQVIENYGYLELPAFKVKLTYPDDAFVAEIPARKAIFERVAIEETVSFGRRRIDVVGYEPEGRILIEIFVTSRVKGKKLEDVEIADEAMIQIQIQRETIFPNEDLITERLDKSIIESLINKSWLFHPEGDRLKKELQGQALALKLKQRQIEKEAWEERSKKIAEVKSVANNLQGNRKGHVPSRTGVTNEEYVQAMYEFLLSSDKRIHYIEIFKSYGYITEQDVETAEKLGLAF